MSLLFRITDIGIGFSIIAAVVLWAGYVFFMPALRKSGGSIVACTLLLGSLAALQWHHFGIWADAPVLLDQSLYVTLLLMTPPSFYFFSRFILLPEARLPAWQAGHFLPVLMSPFVPDSVVLTVALALGAGYSLWFVYFVFGMRRTVVRYKFELFFFVFFAVEAVLVFLAAIALPYIDPLVFHLLYAIFTSIALVLIVATLIVFPDVVDDLQHAAALAYSKSSLNSVEVDALTRKLDQLMSEEKLYRNEALSLSMVAEALDIGSHQLSELVNVHYQCSFSHFVRGHRVTEAKRLLLEDPKASVLSISLATGFRSQSNFYVAFKEITGESPGAFRKRKT